MFIITVIFWKGIVMSNHIESSEDEVYKNNSVLRNEDVPSGDDFRDLQNEVKDLKEDVSDIKEDIELLDKANRDSSDRWRSLVTQVSLLILRGVLTALLSRYLG